MSFDKAKVMKMPTDTPCSTNFSWRMRKCLLSSALLALKVGMLYCPVRDMILVENDALPNNLVPLGTQCVGVILCP